MMDPLTLATIAASLVVGLAGTGWAGLRAWNGWLELKKMELSQGRAELGLPASSGRIEIADLKERVRKLEAIAAGIDY